MLELQENLFRSRRWAEHTQSITNPETTIEKITKWSGLGTRLQVRYPFGSRFGVDGFLMTRTDDDAKKFDLQPTVIRLRYHQHPTNHRPPNVVDYVFYDREEIPPSMHVLHEGKVGKENRTQLELHAAHLALVRGGYAPAILHANTEELERNYIADLRGGPSDKPLIWPSIGLPMHSVGPIPNYGF